MRIVCIHVFLSILKCFEFYISLSYTEAMITKLTFRITEDDIISIRSRCPHVRILDFLRQRGFSRHLLLSFKDFKKAFSSKHPDEIPFQSNWSPVMLNGVPVRLSQPLDAGTTLTVFLPPEAASEKIEPVDLPFPILFEDAHLLIINKPAGMPVHPSPGNYDNTLANAAAFYFQQKGEPFVFRCINRLDRDTSGLLILACNAFSASVLSEEMRNREIKREYRALVRGITPSSGTIDLPIGRQEGSVILRCVDPENGERAVTHYKRLAIFDISGRHVVPCSGSSDALDTYGSRTSVSSSIDAHHTTCSYVSLQLETGRTHQIRVHMSASGHPLLGDDLYDPAHPKKPIHRQALHSFRLTLVHPMTREQMQFEAPLPEDMQALLRQN